MTACMKNDKNPCKHSFFCLNTVNQFIIQFCFPGSRCSCFHYFCFICLSIFQEIIFKSSKVLSKISTHNCLVVFFKFKILNLFAKICSSLFCLSKNHQSTYRSVQTVNNGKIWFFLTILLLKNMML